MATTPDTTPTRMSESRIFWMRMADNLFRRLWLFVLPIVLFGALGVFQASRAEAVYNSSGVLSSASNPLVADPEIRGTSLQYYETPATGTARLINEQIRTDVFVNEVAELAGLADAVAADPELLDRIRNNVAATPDGTSLLTVSANWADPTTAYELASATILAYRAHLAETSAKDSQDAEAHYRGLHDDAVQAVEEAEDEFAAYLDSLPELAPGLTRSESEQLRLDRLNARVTAAEQKAADLQAEIDQTVLTAQQARSQAGRNLQTIDEPQIPTAPQTGIMGRAVTVMILLVFGTIVSATALVLTTILDRTVTVGAQLTGIAGVGLVATVPPTGTTKRRARTRGGRRADSLHVDDVTDDVTDEAELSADRTAEVSS